MSDFTTYTNIYDIDPDDNDDWSYYHKNKDNLKTNKKKPVQSHPTWFMSNTEDTKKQKKKKKKKRKKKKKKKKKDKKKKDKNRTNTIQGSDGDDEYSSIDGDEESAESSDIDYLFDQLKQFK